MRPRLLSRKMTPNPMMDSPTMRRPVRRREGRASSGNGAGGLVRVVLMTWLLSRPVLLATTIYGFAGGRALRLPANGGGSPVNGDPGPAGGGASQVRGTGLAAWTCP